MQQAVCAVVVTYFPDSDVASNLRLLRPEVHDLVIVDNGSPTDALAWLRPLAAELGATLIELGDNFGIAAALNAGIRHALTLGMQWVLLFDQDSQVTPGFTASMLQAWHTAAALPGSQPPGILVPTYIDKRHGTPMPAILEPDGSLETAITSGTLMRLETFGQLGLFEESLFIDGVDHEYSLRLRRAGLTIRQCAGAVLLHSPGTPSVHRFRLRRKPFLSSNYSPLRRYYQERNKIWLLRRYGRSFPAFFRRQYISTAKEFLKILLYEQKKSRKLRFFLLGIWHGLRGRTGNLSRP